MPEDIADLKPQTENSQDKDLTEAIMRLEMSNQDASKELKLRRYEAHQFLRGWLRSSMSYRKSNYEEKWNRWRRNARNIYDPVAKGRKESWQNALFVPITMQNKEIIKGQLYRTLISGLPYSLSPRPSGTIEESMDIKTLLLRELERSRIEVASNDFFDDLCVYGTAFMKVFHETREANRSQRVPITETPTLERLMQIEQGGPPLRTVGYKRTPPQPTIIYRGITAYHVSIWDMFFSSGARSLQDPHAQRYYISLQEIINGIRKGYYFEECYNELKDVGDETQPPEDKQSENADLYRSTIKTPKTDFAVSHRAYEWWGLMPRKWAYLKPDAPPMDGSPEELIPCKAVFTNESLLSVDENEDYCAESPFLSTGYLHVPGEIYHIGVAEMIEQIQLAINEDTNQRRDNVQLILNRMFAILERAIVSRSDLVSRPGGAIRIKSNSTDDVNKAIAWLETPDVTQSSYLETQHEERFAQSLTGANIAIAGGGQIMAKDVTQTKGGMQILQHSTENRLAYYAMVIEADYITKLIKKYYSTIYGNIDPQDVEKILGPARAARFILRPPEEIENDYHFAPEGVFASINQPIRISQWQAFRDQYKGAPFFDDIQMAQLLGKAIEVPELEKIIVPPRDPITGEVIPFQMMQRMSMAAQAMSGQFMPPEGPGTAGARSTKPQLQAVKAGKNEPMKP